MLTTDGGTSEPVAAVPAEPTQEATSSSTPVPLDNGTPEPTSEAATVANATAAGVTVFPCIEQPLRVNLHCNGYYLWGLRKGRVIARKRRSEKDEFRLTYKNEGSIVEIHNHKFGGTLSVVTNEDDGSKKVVCVQDEKPADEGKSKDVEAKESGTDAAPPTEAPDASKTTPASSEADGDDEEIEDEPAITNASSIKEEDRQWCFVRGTHGRNEVLLKSLSTGENLAIDGKGNIVFASDNPEDPSVTITWDIECVTGELCFISNPAIDCRLRCDLSGLLFLTAAWKGWEVFRLMEASHGYVKISSWMHSQWLLCSTADGTVSTCSHAESFLEDNPKGCSKWAIEKSPEGNRQGVVIRSKTYGRLLSFHDGILKTYDPNETASTEQDKIEAESSEKLETASSVGNWWNRSMKSMNDNMRASMNDMQKRFNSASIKSEPGKEVSIPQKDTTVWQLEAAHLQTYYFISAMEGESPRSIGPFPEVTPNLRKTDKIQLIRGAGGVTKLFVAEKKQYIACSSDGEITFVEDAVLGSTEWIMEKPSYQDGGSVFRSNLHNHYLSFEESAPDAAETETKDDLQPKTASHFGNLFGANKDKVAKLVGSETMGMKEVWRLEPCMPRAVSSEKIKTFALGTSIAVGTTIAMPFALAGMGAILGAVGAEVGIVANAIAVGLTGAEALASVGAIGATAYIVFRPEENSLTDDHKNDDEEEAERAWSKRPFSNWRNW